MIFPDNCAHSLDNSAASGAKRLAVFITALVDMAFLPGKPRRPRVAQTRGRSFSSIALRNRPMIEIAVDVKQIANYALQFDAAGHKTRIAIARALNHAGAKGFTQLKRTLSAVTGVKQSDLQHGSQGLSQNKAQTDKLEYDVVAKSSSTPLSYFSPRQTSSGVSASPWGQRKIFAHSFLATMPSGHVGVWKHGPGPARYVRRISPTSGRAYYSQANIVQLWGPSIAKEMAKSPVPEAFRVSALGDFGPRLSHEIDRLFAQIDPKSTAFAGGYN